MIDSMHQKAWQSVSDGLFVGTEGWERYDINDGSEMVEQVRLHWGNPFWGRTTAYVDLLTAPRQDRKPRPGSSSSCQQ